MFHLDECLTAQFDDHLGEESEYANKTVLHPRADAVTVQ